MGARYQEMYVTIAQSGFVSELISIRHARDVTLSAPEVNSCLLKMQGSTNTTSANFKNIIAADGSTRWVWEVEDGNTAIPITGLELFPYLRIEVDVAQTDVRTFTIGVKL